MQCQYSKKLTAYVIFAAQQTAAEEVPWVAETHWIIENGFEAAKCEGGLGC